MGMTATETLAPYVMTYVFPAAFALLPGAMDTPEARASLLAIGLQESKFRHRVQVLQSGARGPAHGLWQFERGGAVKGVLQHPATRALALQVCRELLYRPDVATCHVAIEHNDILACCFARLNLWWLPGLLARRHNPQLGWQQYLAAWRPGRPHPETWDGYFGQAWEQVQPAG